MNEDKFKKMLKDKYPKVDVDKFLKVFKEKSEEIKPNDVILPLGCDLNKHLVISILNELI